MLKRLWWEWGRSICWLVLIVILLGTVYLVFDEGKNPTRRLDAATLLLAGLAFIFSADQAILKPFFDKPRLQVCIDAPRHSEPTQAEANQGVKKSVFLRLRISNLGRTPARNCVGRLLEVQNEEYTRIASFDPLSLYWARQSKSTEIRGYADVDYDYLDVAQADYATDELVLKVIIPDGHRLVDSPQYPNAHHGRLPRGIYYLFIGIFADEGYHKPEWFTLIWEKGANSLPELRYGKIAKKKAR